MKFKVGEICEARSHNERFEGWREVEIVAYAGNYPTFDTHKGDYLIQIDDGRIMASTESHLRKKFNPPKDQWQAADKDFMNDLAGLLPVRDNEIIEEKS